MRTWLRRSLLILGLIGLAVTAALLALPHAAPRLIAWQLDRMGVEGAVGQVAIGRNRAVLQEVRLGEEQTVERLQIDYDLADLVRGRIAQVRAAGVRVRARLGPDGLQLPGLPEGGDDGGGPFAAPLPGRIAVEDLVVALETPVASLRLAGELVADVAGRVADFELSVASLEAQGLAGAASLEGRLAGRLDLAAADPVSDLQAQGSFIYGASDLALPELDAWLDAQGQLDLAADDGQVQLTTTDSEWVIDGDLPAPGPAGAELPVVLRLGNGDQPFRLDLAAAGHEVALEGPLAIEAGPVAATARLAAEIATGGDDAGPRVRSASLQVRASGLRYDQIEAGEVTLDLTAQGTAAAASASGRLEMQVAGVLPADVRVEQVNLAVPFAAEIEQADAAISLTGPGTLAADGVSTPGMLRSGRLDLQVAASEAPLVRLDLASADWRVNLPLVVQAIRLEPADDLLVGTLVMERGRIRLEVSGRGGDLEQGAVVLEQAVLASAEPEVRLEGASMRLPLGPDGLVQGSLAPFAVETIRPGAELVVLPPLTASGQLRPEPDALMFEATVQDTGRRATLRLDGRHDLVAGRGAAEIELSPLEFAPGQLQPSGLVPGLGAGLEQVSGRIALDGEVAWSPAGFTSDLELLLDRLALTAGPARVEGLAGVVTIDNLAPPSTPPDQRLAIGLLDLGLTFIDGRTTFRLEPGGPLVVDALRFEWAGGELQAQPFTVGSDDLALSTTLQAEGLDLSAIFEEVRLPGLSGQGTIDGTLPVRIAGGEAVIEQGELRSRRPGWIRYRPDDTPDAFAAGGESMGLLLQALENFRYDELRLTLDGRTDAAMDIGLHLKGANPDLYDGHPIEFNLDLEGELANILRSGLRSYTLPDRIRERIQGFGTR